MYGQETATGAIQTGTFKRRVFERHGAAKGPRTPTTLGTAPVTVRELSGRLARGKGGTSPTVRLRVVLHPGDRSADFTPARGDLVSLVWGAEPARDYEIQVARLTGNPAWSFDVVNRVGKTSTGREA